MACGIRWRGSHAHHLRRACWRRGSALVDEARLPQHGDAVVEAGLLGDEAGLDLEDRSAAADPLADDVAALSDEVRGSAEGQLRERRAELRGELADLVAALARRVQRVLEADVRGGDLVDHGRVEVRSPELGEPATDDSLAVLYRHGDVLSTFCLWCPPVCSGWAMSRKARPFSRRPPGSPAEMAARIWRSCSGPTVPRRRPAGASSARRWSMPGWARTASLADRTSTSSRWPGRPMRCRGWASTPMRWPPRND